MLSHLARVPFNNTDYLPCAPGIYIVSDDIETPIYVGKSKNLRDRHEVHEKEQAFKEYKATLIFYESCSLESLDAKEYEYIKTLHPKLNIEPLETLDNNDLLCADLINHASHLKRTIKQCEAEFDEIKPRIAQIIGPRAETKSTSKCKSYKTDNATFSIKEKEIYTWSDEIKQYERDKVLVTAKKEAIDARIHAKQHMKQKQQEIATNLSKLERQIASLREEHKKISAKIAEYNLDQTEQLKLMTESDKLDDEITLITGKLSRQMDHEKANGAVQIEYELFSIRLK